MCVLTPQGSEPFETRRLTRKKGTAPELYAAEVAEHVCALAADEPNAAICIDAPLFSPRSTIERRAIEKLFQRKPFSTNKSWAGVQPNNPEGIRETVALGSMIVTAIGGRLGARWYRDPCTALQAGATKVIAEVYPTLALALLSPLSQLVARRSWFSLYGKPFALMRALAAARDHGRLDHLFTDEAVALMTDEALLRDNRDKDDVAAIASAFLGDALVGGRASVFWCAEGHYVLPHRDAWHPEWTVAVTGEVSESS